MGFSGTAMSLQSVMLKAAREHKLPARTQHFWQNAFSDVFLDIAKGYEVITYDILAQRVLEDRDELDKLVYRIDMLEKNVNNYLDEVKNKNNFRRSCE